MPGFSISLPIFNSYIREADGKQNPYSKELAQKGDGVSRNEAAMHLVDLQNGAGGADRASKGSLYNTILNGNGGDGFFSQLANLVSSDGKIGEDDTAQLAKLAGDPNKVEEADFQALKKTGSINVINNGKISNIDGDTLTINQSNDGVSVKNNGIIQGSSGDTVNFNQLNKGNNIIKTGNIKAGGPITINQSTTPGNQNKIEIGNSKKPKTERSFLGKMEDTITGKSKWELTPEAQQKKEEIREKHGDFIAGYYEAFAILGGNGKLVDN